MNNEKNIFSDTYEIIGYLQSGSGGAVYKAYHKRNLLCTGFGRSITADDAGM